MDKLLSKQARQVLKGGGNAILVFEEYGQQISSTVYRIAKEAMANPGDGRGDGVVVSSQEKGEQVGETEIDPHYIVLKNLREILGYRLQRLRHADLEVHRDKKETQTALKKRDNAIHTVRQRIIRLRASLEGIYGSDFSASIGLSGETPDDPTNLKQTIQAVLHTVSKDGFSFPAPLDLDTPSWTRDGLLSYLRNAYTPLEESLLEVERETKEDQHAQILRRDALARARQSLMAFSSTLETWARLALLPEIADRVRPTTRTSDTQNDEDEDPSVNPSQDPSTPPTSPSP